MDAAGLGDGNGVTICRMTLSLGNKILRQAKQKLTTA